MKRLLRNRPSPALVIACIALFAALGGTAVGLPGKNKIDKNDLQKAVVKAKNIKKNAVTASKIKAGAVGADKLAAGSVGAAQLGAGAVSAAKLGTTVVRTADSALTGDSDGSQNGAPAAVATATATAACLEGETLISGGAKWIQGNDGNNENLYINESYPNGNSWVAEGIVDFGAQGQARIQAIAICLQ